MALATSLAIALILVRWYLGRRHRRPADPGWTTPVPDRSQRSPAGREPVGAFGSHGGQRTGSGATGPNRPAQPSAPQPTQPTATPPRGTAPRGTLPPGTAPPGTAPPGTVPPGTVPPSSGTGRTGPQTPPRGRRPDPYRP
jgi:hypothetical protein